MGDHWRVAGLDRGTYVKGFQQLASIIWLVADHILHENKKELVILQQTESWVTCSCQMELACQQETMNYFPHIGITLCNFLQESQV